MVMQFFFLGGGGGGGINKVHYGLCENGEYLKDTLQFRFWGLLLVSRIERDEHRNEVAYSVFNW